MWFLLYIYTKTQLTTTAQWTWTIRKLQPWHQFYLLQRACRWSCSYPLENVEWTSELQLWSPSPRWNAVLSAHSDLAERKSESTDGEFLWGKCQEPIRPNSMRHDWPEPEDQRWLVELSYNCAKTTPRKRVSLKMWHSSFFFFFHIPVWATPVIGWDRWSNVRP